MNVLICEPKASNISGISDAISPRYIRKNPRSMYARVPHMMAQFVDVIGLHAVQFGNNWMRKISRTAKIGLGLRPRPIWLSEEFFEAFIESPLALLKANRKHANRRAI